MNERNESTVSASREKKTRQTMTDEINDKQLKARQEAAKAKRSTVFNTVIGVVVAVLVAALLLWNSGVFQKGATAATIGDVDYSPAEVSYYYTSAYQEVYMMAQYGLANYNPSLPPQEQTFASEELGRSWLAAFWREYTA